MRTNFTNLWKITEHLFILSFNFSQHSIFLYCKDVKLIKVCSRKQSKKDMVMIPVVDVCCVFSSQACVCVWCVEAVEMRVEPWLLQFCTISYYLTVIGTWEIQCKVDSYICMCLEDLVNLLLSDISSC